MLKCAGSCGDIDNVVKVTLLYWSGVPLCLKCRQKCVDNGAIPHLTYAETYATKSQSIEKGALTECS